jgi:hypothetical protein
LASAAPPLPPVGPESGTGLLLNEEELQLATIAHKTTGTSLVTDCSESRGFDMLTSPLAGSFGYRIPLISGNVANASAVTTRVANSVNGLQPERSAGKATYWAVTDWGSQLL